MSKFFTTLDCTIRLAEIEKLLEGKFTPEEADRMEKKIDQMQDHIRVATDAAIDLQKEATKDASLKLKMNNYKMELERLIKLGNQIKAYTKL